MYFCPFCGTLLLFGLLKPESTACGLCCANCRYVQPMPSDGQPLTVHHSFRAFNKASMDDDTTLATSQETEAAAAGAEGGQLITIPCENDATPCDSTQAYYIQIQMRSADEPATTFFKCTKCGFQWRQG